MFRIVYAYDNYSHVIIDPDRLFEYNSLCKNVLDATKLAIEKWELILSYLKTEVPVNRLMKPDSATCGLCRYSGTKNGHIGCDKKCPIFKKTKEDSCYGTPYYTIPVTLIPQKTDHITAVQSEINFLRDLLDELTYDTK